MAKKHEIHLTDADLRMVIYGLAVAVASGPVDESKAELRTWKRLEELREWLLSLQEDANKPWGTQA